MGRYHRGDDLLAGLGPALAIGVVVAGVGALFVWGLRTAMALAVLAFFGWLTRWLIRIF